MDCAWGSKNVAHAMFVNDYDGITFDFSVSYQYREIVRGLCMVCACST